MDIQSSSQTIGEATGDRRHFTLADANRALPYVRRIALDVQSAYRNAIEIQQRLEHPLPGDEMHPLQRDRDQAMRTLNDYLEELKQVGVELRDHESGLLDFPAMHEGREVCLCWKLGEDQIAAWHETDAGFAGRQDLALLEAEPTPSE